MDSLRNHQKKACVLLPTYNEAENVAILIPLIFKHAEKIHTHEIHVVVADDESPDGTGEMVQKLAETFPRLHLVSGQKQGLGVAYIRGFIYSNKEINPDLVIQMDADLQHDPSLLPLFVGLTELGFNLVIGSRFVSGGSTPNFSFSRKMQSLFGNWLIRVVGGIPRLRDCTSGYRCMTAEILNKVDFESLSPKGYSFLPSLLTQLLKNGAQVIEIPITFPDRSYGSSKLALKDKIEFLFNLVKLRFG